MGPSADGHSSNAVQVGVVGAQEVQYVCIGH